MENESPCRVVETPSLYHQPPLVLERQGVSSASQATGVRGLRRRPGGGGSGEVRGRGWASLRPVVILLALLAGCSKRPPVHDGPVVFITLNGLRADVVSSLGGATPGLTPNLDRLMASASWAGRAVAPSSSVVAATASLLTGLRPWQTQVLRPGMDLSNDLLTLPEALQSVGYSTHGYYSGHWMERENG